MGNVHVVDNKKELENIRNEIKNVQIRVNVG